MQLSRKKIVIPIIIGVLLVVTSSSLIIRSNSMSPITKINTFDQYVTYYDISEEMQGYLQELANKGYHESHIRIAYAFLNDRYGKKEELENLLKKAREGQEWSTIFTDYSKTHDPFMPRSFDSDYLDRLMESSTITSDDIIICDRLSFVSGEEFDTLMTRYLEGESFTKLGEDLKIINSEQSLIRVPVTTEEIEKYKNSYGLSEEKVIESFVIASKFNVDVDSVVAKALKGETEEEMLAYYFVAMFE